MGIPENYRDIESYDVRHGPVIAAYCDRIGLVSIINKALKANMDIDCGKVVKGLILNTLSGRDPLYRVEEYFSHQDRFKYSRKSAILVYILLILFRISCAYSRKIIAAYKRK